MSARLEAEKALLIQRAELERLSMAAAWMDTRNAVMPATDPRRMTRGGAWAARAVRIAIPVLGLSRVGRIVQLMSVGLMVFRIVRGLR